MLTIWRLIQMKNESLRVSLKEDEYEKLQPFFAAMASITRLRILFALCKRELCVQEIAASLNISSSLVSHQMKLLKTLDIVKQKREGKYIYYSIADNHVQSILDIAVSHVKHK